MCPTPGIPLVFLLRLFGPLTKRTTAIQSTLTGGHVLTIGACAEVLLTLVIQGNDRILPDDGGESQSQGSTTEQPTETTSICAACILTRRIIPQNWGTPLQTVPGGGEKS